MNKSLFQRAILAGALLWVLAVPLRAQTNTSSNTPSLYAISFFNNQLFTVDTNGQGTLLTNLTAHVSGYGIAARYGRLYTFDPNTDQIVPIDPVTGALGTSINIGVSNLVGEGDLAFRGDGVGFLVSALHTNGSIANDLYTFDIIAGTSQRVATTSGPIDALAFDSDNTLYALGQDGTNLYTLDQEAGTLTAVGSLGIAMSSPFAGMTFGPDGTLYAAINDQLYILNKTNGTATAASTNVVDFGFSSVSGLAFALPSAAPLTLTLEGTNVVLFYSGAGTVLQASTNVAGPYTNASIAANPARLSPTNSQLFFRLLEDQ